MLGDNNFGFWGGGTGGGGGGGGTVTSVGLSMPPAFSVANSPVTSFGTINVSGAGLASQYIRGDGTLADLPAFAGGAGSQQFYFNGGVSQGTIGGQASFQMSRTANTGAAANFSTATNGILAQFITDIGSPNQSIIPAGSWFFSAYFNASSSGGTPQITATISKWDGTTLTAIATSEAEVITGGTSIDLYNFAAAVPQTSLLTTDRIVVTFNVITDGRTITLYTQSTRLSSVTTTFTNAISSLNGLTANVQFFQTTTNGTDFGITSSGCVHCFNLPTASCTNRGALSAADYCRFYNATAAASALTYSSLGTSNIRPVCGTFNYGCVGNLGLCQNTILGGDANNIGSFGNMGGFVDAGAKLGNTIAGGVSNNICNTTICSCGAGSLCFNPPLYCNTIGGGNNNTICSFAISSVVAGGSANQIGGYWNNFLIGFPEYVPVRGSFIGGGELNGIYGNYCGVLGLGTAVYNSSIVGGCNNFIGASFSFIGGGFCNRIDKQDDTFYGVGYGFIGGGCCNYILSAPYAAILHGNNNSISSDNITSYSMVLGGQCNTVTGCYSGVANLCGVNATANCTFYFCNICVLGSISGGGGIAAPAFCYSSVGSQNINPVTGTFTYGFVGSIPICQNSILGGDLNSIGSFGITGAQCSGCKSGNVISGGVSNSICNTTFCYSIGGLCFNPEISCSVIGGGFQNNIQALNLHSVIAGGCSNRIGEVYYQSLCVYYETTAKGNFIGGGGQNAIYGTGFSELFNGIGTVYSAIVGGQCNLNAISYGFIGSGFCNTINKSISCCNFSFIGGGCFNSICDTIYASILNGNNNVISPSAQYSIVLGGQCNTVTGCYSGVANLCGVNATANCTFYFCNICVLGSISGGGGGGGSSIVFCNGASGCVAAAAAAGTTYYYNFTAAGCLVLPTAVGNTSVYCLKNTSTTTCIVACFTAGQNADGTNCILLMPQQALGFISTNTNFSII